MLCGTFRKRSGYSGDEYRLVRSNTMPRIVSGPRDVSMASVRRTKSTRTARPLLIKDLLHTGLDNVSSATLRPFNSDINTPRIDSYRFSMANLEDSQDVDLDAILGELCALERRCDGDIAATPAPDSQRPGRPTSARINPGDNTDIKNEGGMRTDSPDNDSAFSDTVSMLSSESSASSSGSGHKPPQTAMHTAPQQQSHQFVDTASKAKAEKIRLALEKMREASVQKLFIKAFTLDGSGKSLLVDEGMSVAHVCRLLADKNHVPMDPKWAVVEHLPDLFMERVYEDHELLVENLLLWTRDSKNKLLFVERPDKTQLFLTPERFLLGPTDRGGGEYDDHSRNILLEEFFSSSNVGVPEVEGPLYLKSDSKKGWKRYHFILRASGLYYWPKEKARTARDLVCLATFDVNQVYYGVGWRKKYKAPTDFCFAVKHPRLQQPKSTKYIKFLCAEDNASLERWIVGIRVAKYGRQLMENYRALVDELAQEDLDLLAHARSCSVSSIAAPPNQTQYNTTNDNARQFAENVRHSNETTVATTRQYDGQRQSYNSEQRQSYNNDGRLSRASSSSSSGCLSDGAPSSCEVAFECGEFPTGTIKRKPSMNPKLPLTSITRQLKEVGETVRDEPDSCPSPTSSGSGTLTRRHSRRRSGTDSDGSGTLKRHHRSGNATPVSPVPPSTPVRERASPMGYSRSESQESSKTPTSPIQACMMDSITSLPPPPSPSRVAEEVESDSEPLPPPPPEMFRSNLSLDSLPPPPAPGELPVCNTPELTGSSLSLASLPPPPSPLVGETGTIRRARPKQSTPTNSVTPESTPTHNPNPRSQANQMYTNSIALNNNSVQNYNSNASPNVHANNTANSVSSPHNSSYPGSTASTPTYTPNSPNFTSPPPFVPPPAYGAQPPLTNSQSLGRQNSKVESIYQTGHHNTIQPIRPNPNMDTVRRSAMKQGTGHYAAPPYLAELKAASSPQPQRRVTIQEPPTSPKSKTGTGKKISFNLPPQQEPGSPALPQRKPTPPRRSDSTRLTSPKKLAASDQAPPGDFLKDLQRVMRKKWQVAQKCKLDSTTTPHEVLGFRDPPPAVADYRETNVSNWVQEHYGADNLYENVYATDPHGPVEYASSPARQTVRFADENRSMNIVNAIAGKRRPPPPPPKRAETTHLTTTRAMH
ncbi:PREDICTED: ras-associated and pleckstrin homology domains-containing protein 1-like isoform X1 [Trachymyrmex septentrionalis]|uniref:ras-associated and pleckstrin homology domains-containing protein 1-like isoform X1 n=1 Tax=Trachymyrmex septentrionalis TaxID=34720 RepID=UPI00084F2936|nr:PREDICTED: ras-associated and pleckstrin homology domains-containing protein 1-like isoform X1 [Trachymyrmex septentrionalis]